MTFLMQAICGHIWKRILEKTQTNATNVTMAPLGQTFWGHIWKHTASENSLERLRFYRSVCEFTGASESKRGFLKFWWSIWDFLGASVECMVPKKFSMKKRSLQSAQTGSGWGEYLRNRYALTIQNMYIKGVSRTFLSVLFLPEVGRWLQKAICQQN